MADNGPFRVRLLQTVRSDLPRFIRAGGPTACPPGERDAWCNDYGAVWIKCDNGEHLGVRPGEFEYVTLPPAGIPLAMTPAQCRAMADENARLTAALADAKAEGERMREGLDAISDGTCCQTNHAPECCNCAAQRAAAALASGGQAGKAGGA